MHNYLLKLRSENVSETITIATHKMSHIFLKLYIICKCKNANCWFLKFATYCKRIINFYMSSLSDFSSLSYNVNIWDSIFSLIKLKKQNRWKIPSNNQIDSNQSSINAWYCSRKKSIKQSVSLFTTQEYQSYGDIISTNKQKRSFVLRKHLKMKSSNSLFFLYLFIPEI